MLIPKLIAHPCIAIHELDPVSVPFFFSLLISAVLDVAVAAYVENGGFGATYAAPMASLMVEKYLKGTVKRTALEERMKNADLMSRVKTN